MKKLQIFILFSFIFFQQINAQVLTKKSILLNTAKSLEIESRASYSNALIKAKEKRWPLFYQAGNNRRSLMGIDASGMPVYYTSFADPIHAISVNTNKVWPTGANGFNLTGENDSLTNKFGVWDQGAVRSTHFELKNRIVQKDNATTAYEHGTHVFGIVMGKGLNPLAKGMSYNLKGAYSYDWNQDNSEMSAAAANGMLISNHSYGIVSGWDQNSDSSNRWEFNGRYNEKEDYKFGLYNSDAQIHDSIMYNAPYYLIVKAAGNNHGSTGPKVGDPYWRRDANGKMYNAGTRPDSLSSNDGYETLSADINAKNLLVVGGVYGLTSTYSKKEDVVMSWFSSWGPTDDGRIKPDIVADGVNVFSAIADNDSSYGYKNGTSMASPNAAGSLLLLQELSQQLSPNKFLRSATVKALAIHTANEAGLNPGPDYKFGWGLLNMFEAATALKNALTTKNGSTSNDLVYENILNNLDSNTYTIIASGKKPVKATIVWNDVKGTVTNSLNDNTPQLVNDLDLTITQGNNTTKSWKLNPQSPASAAFKGDNILDNVEKVEIDTTLVGKTYLIKVKHKRNLDRGQQAYTLVISGAGGTAYCASTSSSSAGTKIDSISINNIQYVPGTNKEYVDNTNLLINGEPNSTLNLFVKLGSADATNNTRFVKTFIDYNNNGSFETNELVNTSTGITNGNYTNSITLPDTLQLGRLMKLRIVVMETTNSANVLACGTYTNGETQDYTLRIINPSSDLQMSDLVSPQNAACKKSVQYVTVKITNNGTTQQSNIPVSLFVKKGTSTILNISETFNGRLGAGESMNYTFQKPINLEAATNYSFTATVSSTIDQQKDNNTLVTEITTAANNLAPTGTANNCNNSLKLAVNTPIAGNNYIWYDSANLVTPIAVGSNITATSTKNNLYLTQGYQGFVGPAYNTTYGAGGYNNFKGNYMKVTTGMPLTINTVKLYTSNAGKIQFELMYMATDSTYYPGLSQFVTVNAAASSPSPTSGASNYVAGDSGRIYELNFKLNVAGNYYIVATCDSTATLYRNNGITTNPYPIGPNKVFSYSGNSVTPATGNFQNYFYFFYNTQISTSDCDSPPTTIPVNIVSAPTFKLQGDSLTATSATTYQWYMNDETISGATSQVYKPLKNAIYKVMANTNGCQMLSENKVILLRDNSGNLVTDVVEGSVKDINLKITSTDFIENLIKGNAFYIQFSNLQTNDISLDVLNSMGHRVAHKDKLINQRTAQKIDIENLVTGVYYIKIYANNKIYVQRVFITNN
jgi:hypothetical protein